MEHVKGNTVVSFKDYSDYLAHHKRMPTTDHDLDFLFDSNLLQPVEIQTLASFLGTRVHNLLLLDALYGKQLDGRLRNRGVVQHLFTDVFLTTQQRRFFASSGGILDVYVNRLAELIRGEVDRLDIKLLGVEIPVCDPYKAYVINGKAVWMETRVDGVGVDQNGHLYLIEYKTVWAAQAASNPLKTDHVHQVLLNAWMLFMTYNIMVDKVLIIYASRYGDVTTCSLLFKPSKHNDHLDVRSERLMSYLTSYQTTGKHHYIDTNQVLLNAHEIGIQQRNYLDAWKAGGRSRVQFETVAQFTSRVMYYDPIHTPDNSIMLYKLGKGHYAWHKPTQQPIVRASYNTSLFGRRPAGPLRSLKDAVPRALWRTCKTKRSIIKSMPWYKNILANTAYDNPVTDGPQRRYRLLRMFSCQASSVN